jgi:hypothetical protein
LLLLSSSPSSVACFSSLSSTVDATKQPKALQDVKKQLWEFYLSTRRGANTLFETIDFDESGSIDLEDLKTFMMEVLRDGDTYIDPKEFMPYAWNRLEQRAAANQWYDMKIFQQWLVPLPK